MADSFAATQQSPSFIIQEYRNPDLIMDTSIMKQLRWPLFGPKEDIMVMEETGLMSLLDPTQPHPLASQPATTPPRARMLVQVAAIATWDYWQDSGDIDSEPKALVIENEDGHPVTLGQLVASTHQYLAVFEGLLREVFDLPKRGTERFWVAGFQNILRHHAPDQNLIFQIEVDYGSSGMIFAEN